MARVYDKPIVIQTIDEVTETWTDAYRLHAYVNKSRNDNEYLRAGAIRDKKSKTFEVRYFPGIEDIDGNIQKYRIIYKGVPYNIEDYDDYQEAHKTVKLSGVSY